MAQRKTLTDRQVEILRWIADGCPDGVMPDQFHRISAAALCARGFVKTSGRGASWKAAILAAGREYLAQVDGPNPPVARQANVSVTQQLVDDVKAAGGVLRVPERVWGTDERVDYHRRAELANQLGKVPAGQYLSVRRVDRELEITLRDIPEPLRDPIEIKEVPIPEKPARLHPAARQLRDLKARHEVPREQLPRAVRIVHAITKEARQRGWSAKAPEQSANGYGRFDWTGTKNGHLLIVADGLSCWIRVQEEGVRTRGPWEEEVRRYRNVDRDSWLYRDRRLAEGDFDADASGRLKLVLYDHASYYRSSQTRFRRWPSPYPENREVQRKAAEERRAEEARREAEQRERDWTQLMDEARA